MIRVLVLGTINFVVNHIVLDYQEIKIKPSKKIKIKYRNEKPNQEEYNDYDEINHSIEAPKYKTTTAITSLQYNFLDFYSDNWNRIFIDEGCSDKDLFLKKLIKIDNFILKLKSMVTIVDKDNTPYLSEINQQKHISWIEDNENKLKALWKYGYRLYYVADVKKELYEEIAEFIESGILL